MQDHNIEHKQKLKSKISLVDEILKEIQFCTEEIVSQEVGLVLDSGDGIARIGGLPGACMGEMLDFGKGVYGVVFNLEMEEIIAVILDSHVSVREGDSVKKTGKIIEVPVGDALIGRAINPLGVPIDGLGDVHAESARAHESVPPGVIDRKPVDTPLQTGYMTIDAMVPIGHGQRELIIGDRQTGKTTLAIDTIINQRGKDVICVYVAIGQKNSTVAQVKKTLEQYEAMEYSIIVNAPASSPSSMQFYAPYAGCAIAEYFMLKGKKTLVVYDDLTKHAHAYRNISLLLKRPPGREAYPGDVFYIHSRLLERASQMNDTLGGGSMTALPIVETQDGDVSAYIPTNIISITDGQIFLSSELFHSNIKPAINPGISVSRVGGAAQVKGMKRVAGLLRLTLAQFREKEKFSLFASDLDERTTKQLVRGRVLIEALKQKQHEPKDIVDQILIIFVAINGYLDKKPIEEIGLMLDSVLALFKSKALWLYEKIKEHNDITDEIDTELRKTVKDIIAELS